MPARLLTLLFLLPALAALAERPNLHTLVDRLFAVEPNWRLERVSEGLPDDPEDCELAVRSLDLPIVVAFSGPRGAVRNVTALVGPVDIETREAKKAVSFARDTLARVVQSDQESVGRWVRENGRVFLEGGIAKPLVYDNGLRLIGQSWSSDDGITITLSASFPEVALVRNGTLGVSLDVFLQHLKQAGDWRIEETKQFDDGYTKTPAKLAGDPVCVITASGSRSDLQMCEFITVLPLREEAESPEEFSTRFLAPFEKVIQGLVGMEGARGWNRSELTHWFGVAYGNAVRGDPEPKLHRGGKQLELFVLGAGDGVMVSVIVTGAVEEDAVEWSTWLDDHSSRE